MVAGPPQPPISPIKAESSIQGQILASLSQPAGLPRDQPGLPELYKQYVNSSGHVLDYSLPYELSPTADRRTNFDVTTEESAVSMIAHCVCDSDKHKVTLSSGFALEGPGSQSLMLTCAHTLEEANGVLIDFAPRSHTTSSTTSASGTFVVTASGSLHPVSAIMAALPRSDLLLLSKTGPQLKTLPVSPYPAPLYTRIRAHFIVDRKPDESGWRPWVGETWSKWVKGTVLGYRDFAGREAQPGTYDALSHILFEPLPTAGSSGGPIIDEETGAVVGVILGTRMDNRVEGVRGWGVPSETIFEMFSLPGLKGKR